MKTVNAYEAKTNLSRLLSEVERGRRFTITRHGKEIAILIPASRPAKGLGEAIEELKKFGAKHTLKGMSIKKMIEEGRD